MKFNNAVATLGFLMWLNITLGVLNVIVGLASFTPMTPFNMLAALALFGMSRWVYNLRRKINDNKNKRVENGEGQLRA